MPIRPCAFGVGDGSRCDACPFGPFEPARTLLASIEVSHIIGLRDRAILNVLAYTACRGSAAAKVRIKDFQHTDTRYLLRFVEKRGESRQIPVLQDLEGYICTHIDAAGLATENKESPLFGASNWSNDAAHGERDDLPQHRCYDEAKFEKSGSAVATLAT
jgi:hypothetical protein